MTTLTIEDFDNININDFQDTETYANDQEKTLQKRNAISDYPQGFPIMYSVKLKKFVTFRPSDSSSAFLGLFLQYDENTDTADVLYKNFLLHDPIKISSDVRPQYVQIYIKKIFEQTKNSIIAQMPRIKKLKRLNLKMMNRSHTQILQYHFNKFVSNYEKIFGYEQAQLFRASIATTPFYIIDEGMIKLYDFSTNELSIPDQESVGNFLCYFTFHR